MDNNDKRIISQNSTAVDLSQVKNNNKRSLSDQDSDKEELNDIKSTKSKKRRDDLICVICQGPAFGYNFDQISCSSCKEFFRRTALVPIEKTKCKNNKNHSINIRCEIRFDMKQKCQRCRLLKCFESGMRTDHLITPEEKLSKKQRMEQNRRIRSAQSIEKNAHEMTIIDTKCEPVEMLTDKDRARLTYIENAHLSALKSIPSASSIISFEPSTHKTFSFYHLTELDNFTAIKLINFLRSIPEFESLYEEDRLALVKYNLIPLFVLRDLLAYDRKRGLIYDDNGNTVRSVIDERFAHGYHSLYILYYGYESTKLYISTFNFIIDSFDGDLLIIKLLMLVLIFLKGVSLNEERIWILINPLSVFNAHLKYTDLLFRYLIDRYSFNVAVVKMMRIVESVFLIQTNARQYQELTRAGSHNHEIHPLLKSLLGLT